VVVLHPSDILPEADVDDSLQLLNDLPWLHVTPILEHDAMLDAKFHEAVELATIRADISLSYGD
jgi:hypothetical protein